jgi:hypothetical protein
LGIFPEEVEVKAEVEYPEIFLVIFRAIEARA